MILAIERFTNVPAKIALKHKNSSRKLIGIKKVNTLNGRLTHSFALKNLKLCLKVVRD